MSLAVAGPILARPLIDMARKTSIGKKIEKGIKDTGKKIKKAFGFNEGGKVRRPPRAYRKGGSVVGGKGALVARKRGRKK